MVSFIFHLIVPLIFYGEVSSLLHNTFAFPSLEAAAVSSVICFPFFYLIYRRDQRKRGMAPGIKIKLQGALWYSFLLGVALCIVGNEIVEVTGLTHRSLAYEEVKQAIDTPPVLLQIVAAGIVIPIGEEMFFRGICFAVLRDKLSFLMSALISAILFGAYHGNMAQGVYAFMIGMVAAWLYEVYHTVLPPILLHIAANVFSLFLTNMSLEKWFHPENNQIIMAIAAILSLVVSIVCIIQIYRKNQSKEDLI